LPTRPEAGAIEGTAADFGIDLHNLLAGKRRLTESKPFRAIFYAVGSCADPDERAASPNKQFVIFSRSENSRFNADEMPNVCRLQRMVGVDPNRSSAHLV
jgi:hypothetical protein